MKIKANKRWIHLQHTRIAVTFAPGNFFIVFSLKNNKKNCSRPMRQLYVYVANESTQNNIIYMGVLHRSSSGFTVCNEKWYICFKGICHYFFLSATDPKARATVSIPWLKKYCVNVSILKCILKLFINNYFQDGGIRQQLPELLMIL